MSSATVAEGAAIWDTSTTATSAMAETGFARLLGFGLGLLLYPQPHWEIVQFLPKCEKWMSIQVLL